MKLTNRHSTYAKRIKPFILLMFMCFDSLEQDTRDIISSIASTVRYFKSKKVYLTQMTKRIDVNTQYEDSVCSVMLNTYIDDCAVCCNDTITLLFPSIKEVLKQEMIMSKDQDMFKEKYSDYLK